ncbi:uncharacterized protein GLRG_00902 [Colletotrichum graminicola M1.001]|uniref:Uncharacterized protein n=1 Tax=Colletotrichum graminicola (strain M1.001 / M2 / FGSC 10212) TaxID=645133 RepID=E3Q406_COLGM|nr:uncharacterized protein GLRG_00902 [Colletotrichum graminicola M1.001]EFQ25758.1 hypothetical protein GLRG_00902 [Colletotrichum graminicola M1.001]
MTPASTYQVLHRIGQTFSHVQYAVCGAAAMLAYGNYACICTHVSIVCPAYARDVIKSWAAATSDMLVYPGEPDIIGIADNDGDVWKVKIKPMPYDGRSGTLPAVEMGFGADKALTKILTMPALVNRIAAAYALGVGRPATKVVYLDDVAGDLIWLLSRICEDDRPEQQLTSQGVPAIRSPEFWIDFTSAYPGLAGLFYDAGLRAGLAESVRPQVEPPIPAAKPEDSPLREGGSGPWRMRRPTPGSILGLRRRRREGPNMTRAEARKVLSDPPFWQRSSGRWTSSQIFRRRREIESSPFGEPVSGFGTRASHFLFGDSNKLTKAPGRRRSYMALLSRDQ